MLSDSIGGVMAVFSHLQESHNVSFGAEVFCGVFCVFFLSVSL